MSALREPEARPDEAEAARTTTVTVERDLTVSIPADASRSEAAAIASAVGAHATDRQRAAAVAPAADSVEYTDRWTLAERLGRFGKRRWPRDVERGDEWAAAARAKY
ncbi:MULTISPECIES: hypothetical protein [Haloarcula]|uniref:hypothetical protein n=1 Tax=Haloarcula TaxID=2237 RepID=UPI0023EDC669|nr:hypothetical protein [Halomicroarcula sp. XH51]